ncbi:MAG TPA: hypothetical protein PLC07_08940 [Bacillota bacterium]|nr:hypothetical protein [Bacillota bacterium]HPT87881.1 hypothetical protein [Bacillota bacterium]
MLKPVDLQTMVPRSMDVQKVQGVQHNRPATDHFEFHRQLIQQSQIQQEQVQRNESSSKGRTIRREDSEKEKRRNLKYSRSRTGAKVEPEAENQDELRDEQRGTHIDVRF